jgi:hypothetical protein
MKRCLVILAAVSILLTGASLAALATDLPLDGSWVVLDENMTAPAFFTDGQGNKLMWTFTGPAIFRITDLYVVSDQFNVYDNNDLVLTTPLMPDWKTLGFANSFTDPPYTTDPDKAWNNGNSLYFSQGSITFGAGSHSITIEDILIPPNDSGGVWGDGTVAFSATAAVPLPSTLLLFAPGLGLLGFWRRKRS